MLLKFLFIYLREPTLQLKYVLNINDHKNNYLFIYLFDINFLPIKYS